MMGTIRPVITEKLQIEYGDESKMLAHHDSSDNRNSEESHGTIRNLFEKNCKIFQILGCGLAGKI